MNHVKLQTSQNNISGSIILPSSKSISNRALIIQALCNHQFDIYNLSSSGDTSTLMDLLSSNEKVLNTGNSGTVMRFLLAYFSLIGKEKILDGDERMRERPIGELVNSLVKMGAGIRYLGKKGYPPVQIISSEITGNEVELDASVSSQFVSALLMIAPKLKNGLKIHLLNEIVSSSYIDLTLSLMQYWGISYMQNENVISIKEKEYTPHDIFIESDWSSASYIYIISSVFDEVSIELTGLKRYSIQGDSVICQIMRNFGIHTDWRNNSVLLTKMKNELPVFFEYDFKSTPDLVPGMAVLCLCHRIPFRFTGLKSLKIKESDRIEALSCELNKLGVVTTKGEDYLACDDYHEMKKDPVIINSHNDHRIILGFSAAACKFGNIVLSNPEVVNKSYPSFWTDLQLLGVNIDRK
jgi:3-phosphoshikimate 1-carboxyvinyltransferase